jgi:hypothetical protein
VASVVDIKGPPMAFLHYCAKCRRRVVLSGRITTPPCCAINYALDGENCSEERRDGEARREGKIVRGQKGSKVGK